MRVIARLGALAALCAGLGACASTTGAANYAAVSCNTPGAIMESPFNSTANPTEGPAPRFPGDTPCYVPGGPTEPAIAQTAGNAHYASAQ